MGSFIENKGRGFTPSRKKGSVREMAFKTVEFLKAEFSKHKKELPSGFSDLREVMDVLSPCQCKTKIYQCIIGGFAYFECQDCNRWSKVVYKKNKQNI